MLNQFYSYLKDRLIEFLYDQPLKGGERFYIQFDEDSDKERFYNILKRYDNISEFNYKHEGGSLYNTFQLNINTISVIIAATVNNITPDFLVTLRNEIETQKNQWKDKAIIFIYNENLDSIKDGSSNLLKEGMPFHITTIIKNLSKEIKHSTLNKAEQEALKFNLEMRLEDKIIESNLWDFSEILALISQGNIKSEDYSKLGLFEDDKLITYNVQKMKPRLRENYNFYKEIETLHEFGDVENSLEKIFDDKGIKKLKTDKWKEQDYNFVKNSYEDNKKIKTLEYIENNKKITEDGLVYWEKPYKETKIGNRKRHIIIFNPLGLEVIKIVFEFDDNISKEYLNKKSEKLCEISEKKLLVNLNYKKGEVGFKRITYTHNNQLKSRYEFNIVILEIVPSILENIKTNFEISESKKRIIIKNNAENICIGSSKNNELINELEKTNNFEIDSSIQTLELTDNVLSSIESSVNINIKIDSYVVPLMIKNEVSKLATISAKNVYKLKREYKDSFIIKKNRLIQGTREYYSNESLKKIIEIENDWISNKFLYAEIKGDKLKPIDLEINIKLKDAYLEVLNYYSDNNSIPTLTYIDDTLKNVCEKYIKIFNSCIDSIEKDTLLTKEEKNILKLGTIKEKEKIILTSVHPLNIAYQLAMFKYIDEEVLDNNILDRLNSANLFPYIYSENMELYRAVAQSDISGWIVYEPTNNVTIQDTNSFLANVIEEKLKQFMKYFGYLFIEGSKAPLKINLINIGNKKEIIKGFFSLIKKQIKDKGPYNIIPIEIALYQDYEGETIFEKFYKYQDIKKISEEFEIDFKDDNITEEDVLRVFQDNIHYYKLKNTGKYQYAHITFCDIVSQDKSAKHKMNEIETGIALEGLLSTVSSINCKEDYRTGFGIKNILNEDNFLIDTAINLNELAANLKDGGKNPYRKDETIITITSNLRDSVMNEIYNSSYWVTFINPKVDLEFFQKQYDNLLIIHYNDQYTSSTYYDAITVTNKSEQFISIVKEYLNDYIQCNENEINAAIKAFNSINGEWLLKMIGSKGQFSREKLSIVAAIKYILSYLDNENIIWIPISLEEILRVAGVKLSKTSGVFTAKNLKARGSMCDDLLMIGLEVRRDESVYLHYYPVEVKLGINKENVITKAKEQINNIKTIIEEQLADNKSFLHNFYSDFFVQLFLLNVKKFDINKIWPEKSFEMIEKATSKLLNDRYEITNNLDSIIGKGAIVSFKKDNSWRAANIEDDILVLDLTEEDAYTGVVQNLEDIKNKIQQGKTDLIVDKLLSNRYIIDVEKSNLQSKVNIEYQLKQNIKEKVNCNEGEGVKNNNTKKLENIRILLGTAEGSNKKVYWEYGHGKLSNRHILISGKSGQGKSYFIQCLLMELSSFGISSIIIDYTDGFKKSQLENTFKKYMGGKVEQFLVIKDKFPLNPFKINKKEIDEGEYIDEDYSDVAERFKTIISAIYKGLGEQQLNSVYQATKKGLEKYKKNMNLSILKKELEEENSTYSKTVAAQLALFFDKDPFNYDSNFDWSFIDKDIGKVFIVQLTGFKREIQLIITEFILWDLWYYKLIYGNKDKPLPVVLDEAQNLDHSEKSPSAKILTEGRKFGWSGWYATQFLKGQLNNDEIKRLENSSEKVYFLPPDSEISVIASNLSKDSSDKKYWERKISSLKKGQCISQGLLVDDNNQDKGDIAVVIDNTPMEERVI